jgi:hypothetical protein
MIFTFAVALPFPRVAIAYVSPAPSGHTEASFVSGFCVKLAILVFSTVQFISSESPTGRFCISVDSLAPKNCISRFK